MKKLGIITMLCSLLFAMNAYAAVDNNDNKTAVSNFVSEVYPNISAEEKEQLTEKLYEEKYGDSKSITFSDTHTLGKHRFHSVQHRTAGND